MVNIKSAVFRIRTLRVASQIVLFILFNAVLFGFEQLPLLLPVLQSLGTPSKTIGDAFGALQYTLYEATFPWLPLASFLVVTVLSARLLCAWACPFGFVQDLLGYVKRKHTEISPRTHKTLIYVKYGVLGIVLFISVTVSTSALTGLGRQYADALGVFAKAPFNALSPHDTLFAVLPTMTYNVFSAESPFQDILGGIGALTPLFWTRVFILGLVLAFGVYAPRSWCRYLCPVGATMALMSHFSFLGIKRDVVHCTKESCRRCVEVCPMKVPILDLPWEKFTHPECTYCLECVDVCDSKALKLKFP